MPILDYHNHLEPQVIYEDRCYPDIAEVWLGRDHYKWRAMRADGIGEDKITGKASGREKFDAWCAVMPGFDRQPVVSLDTSGIKTVFRHGYDHLSGECRSDLGTNQRDAGTRRNIRCGTCFGK